jgi:two-component system OmpR family sensor kinase
LNKKLLFKNKHEKESLTKSFFLFFLSIETLISIIFYLNYQNLIFQKKQEVFLKLKNYSYTLKGKEFKIEIFPKTKNQKFYELKENQKEFYIYVPIPYTENDVFKISYDKIRFYNDLKPEKEKLLVMFLISTLIIFVMAFLFSIYSIHPLRKALNILEETTKDIIHDINTPLMSILVNIKILKMEIKENEEISRIEQSANQLKNLYENLKIASKELEKNYENINLKLAIEKEVSNFKKIYPDIKVELDLENIVVNSDKIAVERIISNLVSNAFKHNIPNGYIKIKLSNNDLVIENSSNKIKNPEKLFDRFYRESQRGLGLGLSIAKKLANELNWKLKIKAEKDRFKVILNF